eukprot:COSAG01_NODE_2283_length_7997_cov_7.069005_6_plen_82_part_00
MRSQQQHAACSAAWWCRHVHARGSLPFLIKLAYTAEPAAQQLQSVSRPLQAVYACTSTLYVRLYCCRMTEGGQMHWLPDVL